MPFTNKANRSFSCKKLLVTFRFTDIENRSFCGTNTPEAKS